MENFREKTKKPWLTGAFALDIAENNGFKGQGFTLTSPNFISGFAHMISKKIEFVFTLDHFIFA